MFERLGHLVIRLRFALLVAWIAAAAAAYLLAPSLEDVGTADETSFLPRDVESMQARDLLATAFPADASSGTATLVASRLGGLSEADRAYLGSLGDWILGPSAPSAVHDVVAGVQSADRRPELASLFRSADGVVELAQVQLSVAPFQRSANDAVDAIRERIDGTLPAGLRVDVTGPAGLGRDYLAAVAEGTDRTTLVTLVLVIVILLLIYRSPVTALVPLVTIGVAFLVSRGILGVLAQAGWKIPSLVDRCSSCSSSAWAPTTRSSSSRASARSWRGATGGRPGRPRSGGSAPSSPPARPPWSSASGRWPWPASAS